MNFQIINKSTVKPIASGVITAIGSDIIKHLVFALKKSHKNAFKKLDMADDVTLVFVGNAEMRKLNHQFRGKDKVTDILSFSPSEALSLGELVFCVPVLKKQAKEHKLTIQDEFTYLFIHGLLHLLDFDHETSARAAHKMYAIQDAIFDKMTWKS